MGTFARQRPQRLAEKLLAIRQAFGDSQNSLLRRIGLAEELTQSDISAFERGAREPSLLVLLQYARLAQVWIDVLVDDELDLPKNLQDDSKREGAKKRKAAIKR